MNETRELERHNRVMDQIKKATDRDKLPKIGMSSLSRYFSDNIHFNGKRLSQTEFQPLANLILIYGVNYPEVKKTYLEIIENNYDITEEEALKKFDSIVTSKRTEFLISELNEKNLKVDEFEQEENLAAHEQVMEEIKSAYEIKDLPRVGIAELNKKLVRAVNDNDFVDDIKASDIKELTNAYIKEFTELEKEEIVKKIVSKYNLQMEDQIYMKDQIMSALSFDETIKYLTEEIIAKDKRRLEIYKIKHDEIMDAISKANRISELPPNLTISSLNGYLRGNTTIYTNEDKISTDDLRDLTDLLMGDHKWEEQEVIDEVKKIAQQAYPDREDAFELLYTKFTALPKTYYLVEEIKYSQSRQTEFIGRGSSNVNVYFVPNTKGPLDGGRFYNCYINRVGNLDLSEILPLDLSEIVEEDTDIDEIERIVQQVDPTFKAAGGIILNKDETIGNISIFKPNDGTVGVSPEEKEKMDTINDLDVQIDEKKTVVESLDKEIKEKEEKSNEVNAKMKQILLNYEKKALALQMELMTSISSLKADAGLDSEGKDDESNRKGLN